MRQSAMPSSSMSQYGVRFRHPFIQYNSLHATLPSDLTPPYDGEPYHIPRLFVYPTLYVLTNDPSYPDHRQYIQIRRVGKQNFDYEKKRIKDIVETRECKYVSIDTEFPGTIHPTNEYKDRHAKAQYALMKANVDESSLIQVGLTLSDADGNLVTCGPSKDAIVWEFVISDFDMETQPFNRKSTDMLHSRGLDFEFHRREGVSSLQFVHMLRKTGLVWERHEAEEGQGTSNEAGAVQEQQKGKKNIRWITFHGAYDFGYLIKALTNSKLPETHDEFKNLVQKYFGVLVYDVKHILKLCYNDNMEHNKKLMGGLELVAAKIGVRRVMGVGHQSGSDSLLTLLVFNQLKKVYDEDGRIERASAGHIYPLVV